MGRAQGDKARSVLQAELLAHRSGSEPVGIDLRDIKDTLPLHTLKNGEPYYLGFFLMGMIYWPRFRRAVLSSLPVAVCGNSGTTSTVSGSHHLATFPA